MRYVITAILAALSLAGLAGCDSQAEPGASRMVRYQVDPARDRSWWLTRDGIVLNSADGARMIMALPGWLWAGAPHCPPDLALAPNGDAVVTSNVIPSVWRIDAQTLAVTVQALQLDQDADKDVGFAALVYSPPQGAFFAYSEAQRSVWKVDRQLTRATKVANTDLARMRSPRAPSMRGPCPDVAHRLTRFAGIAS